jgi:hypothetical protein
VWCWGAGDPRGGDRESASLIRIRTWTWRGCGGAHGLVADVVMRCGE